MTVYGGYEWLRKWIGADADDRPETGPTKAKYGDIYFNTDTGLWERYTGAGWKELPAKHQPPAPATSTWDTETAGPNLIFTDGNMTVTGGESDQEACIATTGRSSGKYYFEVEISHQLSSTYDTVGLATTSFDNENFIGIDTESWSWFNYLGSIGRHYYNNSYVNTEAGGGNQCAYCSFVVMVAVDFGNTSVWFGIDGAWYGTGVNPDPDPTTNTDAAFTSLSGTLYPATSCASGEQTHTLVVTTENFNYTPPSGFSAWG